MAQDITADEKHFAGFLLILFTVLPAFFIIGLWPDKMPDPEHKNQVNYRVSLFKVYRIDSPAIAANFQENKDSVILAKNAVMDSLIGIGDIVGAKRIKDSLLKATATQKTPVDTEPSRTRMDDNGRLMNINTLLLLLVFMGGFLGNMIHIATSFTTFIGAEQFRRSWILWYFVKPFSASALALGLYFVFRGGFLSMNNDPSSINLYGVMTLSLLAGLFTDKATLKLKEIFEVVFRSKEVRPDKLLPMAKVKAVTPLLLDPNSENLLTLAGENLDAKIRATINDEVVPITDQAKETATIKYSIPANQQGKTEFVLLVKDDQDNTLLRQILQSKVTQDEEEGTLSADGYRNNKTEDIATHDRQVPEAVIKQAILDNKDKWLKDYDVKAISVGTKRLSDQQEVNCIVFQPLTKISPDSLPNTKYIPTVIVYFGGAESEKKEFRIPTDVQPIGSTIQSSSNHSRNCHGTWPKRPGCSVSRMNATDSGTIGLKVYRGRDPYLISCYHVLCAPELNIEQYILRNHTSDLTRSIISPSSEDLGLPEDKIGEVVEGYIDEFTDCAMAKLSDTFLLAEQPWSHLSASLETRDLTSEDVAKSLLLSIYGRSSGYRVGRLKFLHTACYIEYTIRNKRRFLQLSGLLQTQRLSTGGDSGAPVYDTDGFIIGIVVATSAADSFVIPINRVLSYLNVTIKPTT